MYIVHVSIKVKEKNICEFKEATIQNAKNSMKEEGVLRFDVLQQQDNPSMFMLTEVYKNPSNQLKHRETNHYKFWRSTILDWLQEPYTVIEYDFIYPEVLEKK